MDAQLQNEEKEAYAETLGPVNPISADMEANPPAIERVVDDLGLSEAHGLPVAAETKGADEAIKEDPSMSEKDGPVDDMNVTPVDTVEVAKACPPTEDAGTHNVEAAISHKAVDACSHTPQFDNAEITLVVDVNTDTEMIDEGGEKGEEIRQGEADTLVDPITTLQVGGQVDALQCKEGGMGTSAGVIHEHTETRKTENLPQQRIGEVQTADQQIGQNELATFDVHVEVETQTTLEEGVRDGFLSEDETKEVERKGEEGLDNAEAQIREDGARLFIKEDAVTSTGGLEAKAEDTLNVVSGSSNAMVGVENDVGGRKGEEAGGGCMDMAVEASDTERGSMDMEVEEEANIRPCVNEVSAGIVNEEREKDGTAGQEPAGVERSHGITEEMVDIVEMVDILKEQESGGTKDDMAGQEPARVERSHGIAEEMVDIVKEQESGSTTLQMELGANETSLENEAVQAGSMQISKGTDGIREGIERAEAILIPTEAFRNEKVITVGEPGGGSNTPTEMDADTIVSEKQRMNVNIFQHMERSSGERANEGMQEMHCETEADTSDIAHVHVERGPVLGIKEDECHQLLLERNTESGKEVAREVSEDHIALCLKKETSKEVVSGQEGHLFGQDLQVSPSIQGPLPNLKPKNIALESSFSEGDRRVQRERQHNRQVHAEMQIRLLPDKSVQADLIRSHESLEGGSGMRLLKESPFAKSKEAKDEELGSSVGQHLRVGIVMQVKAKADTTFVEERPKDTLIREVGFEENQRWAFEGTGYENTACGLSRGARAGVFEEDKTGMSDEANTGTSEEEKYLRAGFEKGSNIEKAIQKRKLSDNLASDSGAMNELGQNDNVVKKAKKKAVNVWAKSTSRKGPKKNSKNGAPQNPTNEVSVLLTPVYVNPDKLEDGPDQPIALSKYDKAEKIELSENRLTASSTKGYRMVRATRGVQDGTWYFEIVVEQLGPTGHTRLGWSTQKGDVQAPVGFDSNSYGYRDLDGSKTHVAVREPYGDLYVEGDVIGFYIHLPNGAEYAPKPAPLLSYRGRPYLSDIKEEQPKKVPGSEICFFRNGVCQGTAFRDINAGRYFPAASMYTLPKEPSCIVRFNFGPEFRFPPVDIGDRPAPVAMVYAPYHNALNGKEAGPVAWANVSATGNTSLNTEPQIKIV